MATTKATTVAKYLDALPAERRKVIAAVREVIREHLPAGFEESMTSTGITYQIPLSRLPKTYNNQPLMYVALAAQKNYNAIYMMRVYGDKQQERQLRDGFARAGKKLDMGKSCIRFQSAEDLPLDTIGTLVASTPSEAWISIYEASRKK